MKTSNVWTRVKREHGLYRYNPTGQYFARVRFRSKLHWRKLGTNDLELAKRKLRDFKNDLARTDASKGNTSFGEVLDTYERTIRRLSEKTQRDKGSVIKKLRSTWFGINTIPLRTI